MRRFFVLWLSVFGGSWLLAVTAAQHAWLMDHREYKVAFEKPQHDTSSCITPLNVRGTCVSLKFCQELLTLYQDLGNGNAIRYPRRLHQLCGMRTADNYPVVCCTRVVENEVPATTTALLEIPATTTTTTTTSTTHTSPPTSVPKCQSVCKPLEECNSLLSALQNNPSNSTLHEHLRASNKICGEFGRTAVCCPDADSNNRQVNANADADADATSTKNRANVPLRLPNEDDGCGFVRLAINKVVGGDESQPGAWPWMALIGYNRYSAQPFKCGGTLITARHVLTAAHCIRGDLSFVRLGEHDLSDAPDVTHVDIDVERMVQHPNFATRANTGKRYDLAILYLKSTVQYSDRIRPICLPLSSELRERNYIGSLPYVAGWGRTEENGPTSNVLQELQIPIVENAECERRYKAAGAHRSADQFDASVLCAGQLVNVDSCRGDSGGPLMIPQYYKQIVRYYQLGIVSYGVGCGRGIPGVYTNTMHYLDWIQQMVADA